MGQDGLHGNQLAKNSPTKIKLGIECASKYLERWAAREVGWHMAAIAIAGFYTGRKAEFPYANRDTV